MSCLDRFYRSGAFRIASWAPLASPTRVVTRAHNRYLLAAGNLAGRWAWKGWVVASPVISTALRGLEAADGRLLGINSTV